MNVVLIDNDLFLLKSLELFLKVRGHLVLPFADPIEALTTIPTFKWKKDSSPVYIVDYLMPQMKGIDFYEKAKSLPKKKFGIITGHFEKLQIDSSKFDDNKINIFPKPIDLNKIIEFVEKVE